MASPTELRTFAELARLDAVEWLMMAKQFPKHEERYHKCALERLEHAAFYSVKADRDEAWNGTEDYSTREAAE